MKIRNSTNIDIYVDNMKIPAGSGYIVDAEEVTIQIAAQDQKSTNQLQQLKTFLRVIKETSNLALAEWDDDNAG